MQCPECGRDFIQTSPLKKYCNIRCTDKAAHKAARHRARLGRAKETVYIEKQLAADAAEAERIRQARLALLEDDTNAALHNLFGTSPKPTIPVPDTGYSEDEVKAENPHLKQLKDI
jgi:hypothetical protein